MFLLLLGLMVVLLLALCFLPRPLRRRRRRALRDALTQPGWEAALQRQVPLYRTLPAALRPELHGHMRVFLREKTFVGCNGLVVDDNMRLVIAAQACLLLLGRATDYFPGFTTILVYPETFVVPVVHRDGVVETRAEEIRLGESWERGPVVLSWGDIERALSKAEDCSNVVLHEFAHKLDEENGLVDGVPALADTSTAAAWSDVLGREYDLLRLRARNFDDDVLDGYGATSPAEFFAVATEAFFEQPRALAASHTRLYEVLRGYYRVDPAGWIGDTA